MTATWSISTLDRQLVDGSHTDVVTVIHYNVTELNRSFHRHVVSPADDWSSASAEVKGICDLVHTDATKAAYEAAQAAPLGAE